MTSYYYVVTIPSCYGGIVVAILPRTPPRKICRRMEDGSNILPELFAANFDLHASQVGWLRDLDREPSVYTSECAHSSRAGHSSDLVFFSPRHSSSTESVYSEIEIDTEPSWEALPDLTLIRVFVYLSDNDRRLAALVCHKWNEIFHTAALWRWRTYDVGKPWMDQALIGFSDQHGAFVQNLRVMTSRPSYNSSKRIQRCISSVLANLSAAHAKLRRFSMERLELHRFWRQDATKQRLYTALYRFFKTQTRLRRLDLHGMQFTLISGLRCLETASRASGHCISVLNIQDIFHANQAVHDNPRFLELIPGFRHLSYLYINYCCLSDEILAKIFEVNGRRLRLLSIKVQKQEPHTHVIQRQVWRHIRKRYPHTKVNLEFDQIGTGPDIQPIMVPGMNLRVLQVWSGYDMDDEETLPDLFNHISENFKDSLEMAVIELDNAEPCFDEALLTLVEACKRLGSLEVNGTLAVPTVAELARLQEENKIRLQRLNLTCCNLTDEELMDLTDVRHAYQTMIKDRELEWEISTEVVPM